MAGEWWWWFFFFLGGGGARSCVWTREAAIRGSAWLVLAVSQPRACLPCAKLSLIANLHERKAPNGLIALRSGARTRLRRFVRSTAVQAPERSARIDVAKAVVHSSELYAIHAPSGRVL